MRAKLSSSLLLYDLRKRLALAATRPVKIGPRLVKRKVGTSLRGVFAFPRAHVARRDISCLHYSFYSSPLCPYRGALPCTSRLPPYFRIFPGSDASTKRREKETIKKVGRQGGLLLRERQSFLARTSRGAKFSVFIIVSTHRPFGRAAGRCLAHLACLLTFAFFREAMHRRRDVKRKR